ncbi:cation:proton antiporter [Stappia indica]|uniref:cation:proton antiporter n=1 Tax=Stappia indica TaxID=538381 RepID=UPI001CD7DE95|nr:cation:proton antiporter [Stappia indica]MCA1299359.1 cation:proton antiporter [Stappia indica]
MSTGLLLLALFAMVYTVFAKWLSSTVLTAPMLFLGFGYALSGTGLMPVGETEVLLHVVAELALILLLFLDAAQTDVTALRRHHVWPSRMLVIGLPLAVIFGTLAAWPVLPGLPLAAVALVAAILAPTDAALGLAVISNPVVPKRERRALTVESGLNDGLALPLVLLFASLSAEAMDGAATDWVAFGLKQILLGPLVGASAGWIGAWAFLAAKERGMTTETMEGIGAISLAGASYLAAGEIGGNGFIAAFVAGLAFGNVVRTRCRFIYEFTENEGQMLAWGAFFLIGLALVPQALAHLELWMLAIILPSLFVVRPLAIWLSLIGTDAAPRTRLFFGWFGPRGLATALFALLVVPQIDPKLGEPLLMLAVNAVWISALLHGVSAVPGARWYGAWRHHGKANKSGGAPARGIRD